MTKEYDILLDRINRFGSMIHIDEFGSHREDTIALYMKCTDEEARILSDLEMEQHKKLKPAVA